MADKLTRRRLLELGAVGLAGLSGCSSGSENEPVESTTLTTEKATSTPTTETTSETETTTAPEPVDVLEHDRLIGAQYYPWYWGDNGFGGYKLTNDNPESWLSATPAEPELGAYDSRDTTVVNQHMRWSLEHGINWWVLTGGAPNGIIDRTIRNVVFEADYADQMNFTLLIGFPPQIRDEDGRYDFDDSAAETILQNWLWHWQEHYAGDPNYLTLGADDRPALYFWSIGQAKGDMPGTFESVTESLNVDPYLIGGPDYFHQPQRIEYYTEAFDALLDYHSYFPNESFLANFESRVVENHRRWRAATHEYGADFIPTVTPGFDHSEAPSEFRDGRTLPSLERDPERFATHCRELRGFGDHDAIVVTSFNEWPEYSAIEPSEAYGETYLDIVAAELATAEWESPDEQPYTKCTLDFNRTYQPSALQRGSSDDRHLAFMATEMVFQSADGTVAVDIGGDERGTFYTSGVYDSESRDDRTWRWFGGESGQTRLFVPVERVSSVEFVGKAVQPDISATVHVDGSNRGNIAFDTEFGEYGLDSPE
jgi:hypothetical protein